TPRWVVQFLVDNSLGKLYLEMYPDSEIRNKYKIANAPTSQTRERKPLHEIRMIDPSTGSGNYLLYGFDMYYDLYLDQIENYGADYNEADVPKLIIENNLHGVDLDDRAIQLAQLGLYIKAKRKKRTAKIEHFNIVSSDFFLPAYNDVKDIFEDGNVGERERKIIEDLWEDLQNAHKFGSLIRLEEKLNLKWFGTKDKNDPNQVTLFGQQNLEDYANFRNTFFTNLQKAVAQNTAKQGQTFLNTKTQDAITFLQLLTQKYDVAVANPPYTDSADFGPELKIFVEANYKQPYKFNTNLYAVFIKRCCEIINENGKVAMVHPPTFMYIKTFEDVRKFIVDKMHISLFVEWGYLGMFHQSARVDAAMYILEKEPKDVPVQFIKLNDIYEGRRYEAFVKDYDDLLANRPNKHNITLPQEKLKIIEGWPFIYWISDGFREKFKKNTVGKIADVRAGIQTSNNNRFLRLWWEVEKDDIIFNKTERGEKRWAIYSKGGPYNKWYGNLWCIVDWKEDGNYLQRYLHSAGQDLHAQEYYFRKGITYSASGSKGISFRDFPDYALFDIGGSSIFLSKSITSNSYLMGLLNSKLTFYISDCLNPTVNVQPQDLKRIPFVSPPEMLDSIISNLSETNISIQQNLCSYRIIETNFEQSPLLAFQGAALKDRVLAYLNYENVQHTQVLINEAIINELIFEVYDLSDADREQVEAKMGISIGSLAVLKEAKEAFINQLQNSLAEVTEHIQNLPITTFEEQKLREFKESFATLYQSNNDLEEFCIRHQVNPINVWYWFKEANTVPAARASEIALEFLADAIRTLLQQDDDGIIPLVGLPGEEALSQRLEQHCLQNGFSAAQYMQLDSLLGRSVNEYLEHHFFNQLSNHLNLFMYLPKTPFIWHLSSGQHQGFEAYILIYKWNRDSLFKLKSHYISHRVQNLEYRQITLQDVNTAQAQTEKETIRLQLQEIKLFTTKIDELIAEGYDPKLDDGVGKNIAPLQKKDLLRAEVLKANQLTKYLNADW
ncbi:MAG: N-6 DNA methylase, partial [Sediminibacterium sp.]|nr:N-6 DNA methylase [Sediminibacterium sp.]